MFMGVLGELCCVLGVFEFWDVLEVLGEFWNVPLRLFVIKEVLYFLKN